MARISVSILVLMELAFRPSNFTKIPSLTLVSILVLMELAFRPENG